MTEVVGVNVNVTFRLILGKLRSFAFEVPQQIILTSFFFFSKEQHLECCNLHVNF